MGFLNERWSEAAAAQTQRLEHEGGSAMRSYNQINELAANPPSHIVPERREIFRDYVEELKDSIKRYVASIDAFTEARITDADRKDVERLDESRRRAHDGLISILETLENLCRQEGLDT